MPKSDHTHKKMDSCKVGYVLLLLAATNAEATLMGALQWLKFVAERRKKITGQSSNYLIVSPQVEDNTLRMDEMQELFRKREADFNTVQDGMRKIEEFQRTKAQMEQELEDVRLSALEETSPGRSHKAVT